MSKITLAKHQRSGNEQATVGELLYELLELIYQFAWLKDCRGLDDLISKQIKPRRRTATSIDLTAIHLRLGELGQILHHHIDGLEVIQDEYKDDCTYKLKVEDQFNEIIHFIIEFGHEYAAKEFTDLVRDEILLESPEVTCD